MAKSIRSKRKRKMRKIRRDKFAPRELAKLKNILKLNEGDVDVEMKDLVTVTDAKKIKADKQGKVSASGTTDNIEVDAQPSKLGKVTQTDENGQYLPWLNQRAIQKHREKVNKKKRFKKKRVW